MRIAFLLLLIPFFAEGQREKISFDDGWKFHFGHASDPHRDFAYKIANIFSKTGKAGGAPMDPKFSDSAWAAVQLPHDWAVALPFQYVDNFDVMAHGYKPVGGLFPETSIGWYRKVFSIPATDSSRRLALQFDGVFRDSEVWLNGHYLGRFASGYTGFNCDLTDFVHFGGENVLTVRVDATQYEGWFYEGAGIYRHVWLLKYNNIHLDPLDYFAWSEVNDPDAEIFLSFEINNLNHAPKQVEVYTFLADEKEKFVADAGRVTVAASAWGKTPVQQKIRVQNPRLWSLNDPYRYHLYTVVSIDGKSVEQHRLRFGIRKIEISPENGLLLNGSPLKIKGVNCHQDHAGVGSALPDYLQYYRIKLLKALGVNAYRTSHNPPSPELLDACDSLGMLVLDETRLLNSNPQYTAEFEHLIRRDRNRPAVFMWSIGNEEGWVQTTGVGKRIAQSLLQTQRKLDPTRTSTYAADLANVGHGINEVIPVRSFNYRIAGIEPYHRDHPRQPLLGTEMGSTVTTRGIYTKDTVAAYVPDQDITYPWWANTAEQWWALTADWPWFMGGFVWTGFDYRGEPTPFEWPNINSHFGIMDMCGFPKNIYYYYQSWWLPEAEVLHITPHWNWPGDEGQVKTVWVNTNAEKVELFLNGKSLGMKNMPRNSHLTWQVPYSPGRLEAVAYKGGKKFSKAVETTGPAVQLVAVTERSLLKADGRDAAVVNIHAEDALGRWVPDANFEVAFSMAGNSARIIGVGNGDPSSHEPDQYPGGGWKRKLFSGRAQVILQTTERPGPARLTISAPGMKPAGVNFPVNR